MNDYQYLIKQLNLLIGFLDVSDEPVYHQIKQHDRFNLGLTIEQLYENSYDNYSNHIATAAFLLGFAHFEDFLTKCIVRILVTSPHKNEYKVTLKTISEKGDNLVFSMAEEQARRLTNSEKLKFIEKNLKGINPNVINNFRYRNDMRNCLMHNNGLADGRLSPQYQVGQKIILDSGQVNGYGLQTRKLASEIWEQIFLLK